MNHHHYRIRDAIERLSIEAKSALKNGKLVLEGFEEQFAEDIKVLCDAYGQLIGVRKALYGEELATSDALTADPVQSIRERAASHQQLLDDLKRERDINAKLAESDQAFQRLADRELVIIASMPVWKKDIHETLAEAVQRTLNQFETKFAEREAEHQRGAKLLADNATVWKERAEVAESLLKHIAFGSCGVTVGAEGITLDMVPAFVEGQIAKQADRADRLANALRDVIGWVPGRSHWHTDAAITAVARAREALNEQPLKHVAIAFDRDHVGRMVRGVWIKWAKEQPNPKPSWLVPFDELNEPDKEVDRRIGETLAQFGLSCWRRHALNAFDLVAHLYRQRAFSERTFGPGERTAANLAHIRKELLEIEAKPRDLTEWIDVVLLAFDGAWRHGGTPESICAALEAKQTKNESRTWPDWRTVPAGEAICHVP